MTVAEDGRPLSLSGVCSTRHPDGTRVQLGVDDARAQAGDDVVSVAHFDDHGLVRRLEVTRRGAAKTPPLWFVEVREATAQPPAINLVAFADGDTTRIPPWTLLADTDLGGVDVEGDEQVGALRWYPATGEVDQIYVAPAWRRRAIATALLTAGATLSVAREWPRFWTDGQRTVLGERLVAGTEFGHRAAPLTHIAPPMTPVETA